jgi:hypothetical protein
VLVDLLTRAPFLYQHYSDLGITPRAAAVAISSPLSWSLHFATGTVEGMAVLFAVHAVFALAFLAGFHTRLTGVITWLLLVSLQARNPAVSYGADAMTRDLMFFSLFLPLSARLSVDAWRRGDRHPDEFRGLPAVALILQAASIYVFTGVMKIMDPSWQRLEAVYFAFAGEQHATPIGTWLSTKIPLMRLLASLTLVVEMFVPFLLLLSWRRALWRAVVCVFLGGFHVGCFLALNVGLFPAIGVLLWVALLPAPFWDALSTRLQLAVRPGVMRSSSLPVAGATVVLSAMVLTLNLNSVLEPIRLPPALGALSRLLRIDQRWSMFISPLRDGWLLIEGTLADGRVVDLVNDGAPLRYDKPNLLHRYSSMRSRKLHTDLFNERKEGVHNQRQALLAFHCREWNRTRVRDDDLAVGATLVMMEEIDHPVFPDPRPRRRILADRLCSEPTPPWRTGPQRPPLRLPERRRAAPRTAALP